MTTLVFHLTAHVYRMEILMFILRGKIFLLYWQGHFNVFRSNRPKCRWVFEYAIWNWYHGIALISRVPQNFVLFSRRWVGHNFVIYSKYFRRSELHSLLYFDSTKLYSTSLWMFLWLNLGKFSFKRIYLAKLFILHMTCSQ